jgi:hypothetical protein
MLDVGVSLGAIQQQPLASQQRTLDTLQSALDANQPAGNVALLL